MNHLQSSWLGMDTNGPIVMNRVLRRGHHYPLNHETAPQTESDSKLHTRSELFSEMSLGNPFLDECYQQRLLLDAKPLNREHLTNSKRDQAK